MRAVGQLFDAIERWRLLPPHEPARHLEPGGDGRLATDRAHFHRDTLTHIHMRAHYHKGLTPPWNSDFHININLQMMYWAADRCDK